MKRLAPLMIIAFASCFMPANSSDKNGNSGIETSVPIAFRSAKWGMSPEQVKQSEQTPLRSADTGGLESWKNADFLGLQCSLNYEFLQNKFILGMYVCSVPERDAFSAYNSILAYFEKSYGKIPAGASPKWINKNTGVEIFEKKISDLGITMITIQFFER